MFARRGFRPFRRLGINVETMNQRDLSISYFALAKRRSQPSQCVARINAARTADPQNSYRSSASLTNSNVRQAVWTSARWGFRWNRWPARSSRAGHRVTSRLEPHAEYHPPNRTSRCRCRGCGSHGNALIATRSLSLASASSNTTDRTGGCLDAGSGSKIPAFRSRPR